MCVCVCVRARFVSLFRKCLSLYFALQEPLAVRREKLRATFEVKEGQMQFATCKDASDTEEILAFLNDSVKDSCEVRALALVFISPLSAPLSARRCGTPRCKAADGDRLRIPGPDGKDTHGQGLDI